jgi:hypothetical protein
LALPVGSAFLNHGFPVFLALHSLALYSRFKFVLQRFQRVFELVLGFPRFTLLSLSLDCGISSGEKVGAHWRNSTETDVQRSRWWRRSAFIARLISNAGFLQVGSGRSSTV